VRISSAACSKSVRYVTIRSVDDDPLPLDFGKALIVISREDK
jgi:hypothetical protein